MQAGTDDATATSALEITATPTLEATLTATLEETPGVTATSEVFDTPTPEATHTATLEATPGDTATVAVTHTPTLTATVSPTPQPQAVTEPVVIDYSYYALGRVLSAIYRYPDRPEAQGHAFFYTYDAAGIISEHCEIVGVSKGLTCVKCC